MIWYMIVAIVAFLGGALFGGWMVDEWLRSRHLKELEYVGLQRQQLAEWCVMLSGKFIGMGGKIDDMQRPTSFAAWHVAAAREADKILKERA